jgi:hypothetical protein
VQGEKYHPATATFSRKRPKEEEERLKEEKKMGKKREKACINYDSVFYLTVCVYDTRGTFGSLLF